MPKNLARQVLGDLTTFTAEIVAYDGHKHELMVSLGDGRTVRFDPYVSCALPDGLTAQLVGQRVRIVDPFWASNGNCILCRALMFTSS